MNKSSWLSLGMLVALLSVPAFMAKYQTLSSHKVIIGGKETQVYVMRDQSIQYLDGNMFGMRLRSENGKVIAVTIRGWPYKGVLTVIKPATADQAALYHQFY
jgi:hypothetical protein